MTDKPEQKPPLSLRVPEEIRDIMDDQEKEGWRQYKSGAGFVWAHFWAGRGWDWLRINEWITKHCRKSGEKDHE